MVGVGGSVDAMLGAYGGLFDVVVGVGRPDDIAVGAHGGSVDVAVGACGGTVQSEGIIWGLTNALFGLLSTAGD